MVNSELVSCEISLDILLFVNDNSYYACLVDSSHIACSLVQINELTCVKILIFFHVLAVDTFNIKTTFVCWYLMASKLGRLIRLTAFYQLFSASIWPQPKLRVQLISIIILLQNLLITSFYFLALRKKKITLKHSAIFSLAVFFLA